MYLIYPSQSKFISKYNQNEKFYGKSLTMTPEKSKDFEFEYSRNINLEKITPILLIKLLWK